MRYITVSVTGMHCPGANSLSNVLVVFEHVQASGSLVRGSDVQRLVVWQIRFVCFVSWLCRWDACLEVFQCRQLACSALDCLEEAVHCPAVLLVAALVSFSSVPGCDSTLYLLMSPWCSSAGCVSQLPALCTTFSHQDGAVSWAQCHPCRGAEDLCLCGCNATPVYSFDKLCLLIRWLARLHLQKLVCCR